MDPLTVVAVTSAAISLLKELIPQIKEFASNNDITTEQQAKLAAEFLSLKNRMAGEFKGVEWEQSGR